MLTFFYLPYLLVLPKYFLLEKKGSGLTINRRVDFFWQITKTDLHIIKETDWVSERNVAGLLECWARVEVLESFFSDYLEHDFTRR